MIEDYDNWFDEDPEEISEAKFKEYEITASPNDFNVNTIIDFIKSGVVKIPGFQRNYVWDIKRASKLIESIIIGIPIPQIFLYEKGKNDFIVIDGQQRLMSLYYFLLNRFPKRDKRSELRGIFNSEGSIPETILYNDEYFTDFKLTFKEKVTSQQNPLENLNYNTLGDIKTSFGLKTIRNIFIKQMLPPDDDSSIFEIFNRLNTGGINLRQQEIRSSLYHSDFYEALNEINNLSEWRRLLGVKSPDVHMKDIEYILRSFSMLLEGEKYRGSLLRHLNIFSKNMEKIKSDRITYLKNIFENFLLKCEVLQDSPFYLKTKKFNISLFESVFVALCKDAIKKNDLDIQDISQSNLDKLKRDENFLSFSESETGRKLNVEGRLNRAKEILCIQ